MSTVDEHYAQVEEAVGTPLSKGERRRLRGTDEWFDLTSAFGDAEMQAEECAYRVRSWRVLEEVEEALPAETMPAGELDRLRAKALLCWALASEDPEVTEWRSQNLGDDYVALSDVGEWVLSRAGDVSRVRGLAFPNGERVGYVDPRAGTVLDRLKWISKGLASEYGWTEDTATAFVLCDVVPIPKWVSRGRLERSEIPGNRSARRALTRCWTYFTGEPFTR